MAKSATILSESFAVIFGNDKISINFVMELSFLGPHTIVWEKCYKNFLNPQLQFLYLLLQGQKITT